MNKKNIIQFTFLMVLVMTLTSCAPKGYTDHEYGFIMGIWHGICFPFALLGKLFSFNVGLFAENNTGFFYWFGFIIGLGGLGGGGRAARH